MDIPGIKKEIKKQGNLIAGSAAFLGLGIAAISSVSLTPLAALMIGGALVPVALDVIGLKILINKPKSLAHDISFLGKPFKKQIGKWFKNYINNSGNLTEKKYKVACLSLWMNHEGYELNKVVSEAVFKDLADELVEKQEMGKYFPLQYMFGESQSSIEGIYGINPSTKTLLEWDKDSPEKLEIAKMVYQEYSNIGMAASAFLKRTNFEELLILQDYKFTKEDYNKIEIYLKEFKEQGMQHPVELMTVKLYSDTTKEIFPKLINEENDIDNLRILQRYCFEILDKSSLEHFGNNIEKKIDYLQLSGHLDEKPLNKPSTKKLKI